MATVTEKTVKFNKFNVSLGALKARVIYSLDNRVDGKKCVTIYAKDYCNDLNKIFNDCYENNSDSQSDYFEKGKVVLFEGHPLYKMARSKIESFNAPKEKKERVTTNTTAIKKSVINGTAFYSAVYRGTEYTAYEMLGNWQVLTRRISLGRWNMGGCKHFPSLEEVAANCPVFAALPAIIAML